MDPEDVTAKLGMAPTWSQSKGQPRSAPDGVTILAKFGHWERTLRADDVAKINELLKATSSDALAPGGIPNATEIYSDVFIARESEAGLADLTFDIAATTLAGIAAAGIPLKVTLAVLPKKNSSG